jgi:hypothetical protein
MQQSGIWAGIRDTSQMMHRTNKELLFSYNKRLGKIGPIL